MEARRFAQQGPGEGDESDDQWGGGGGSSWRGGGGRGGFVLARSRRGLAVVGAGGAERRVGDGVPVEAEASCRQQEGDAQWLVDAEVARVTCGSEEVKVTRVGVVRRRAAFGGAASRYRLLLPVWKRCCGFNSTRP